MTFQRCPTLSPSPEASPGDTWTWFLLADFRTFNPCQYELNYHSNVCWSSQNSTLDQPAITNSMHSQSKYTFTPPLPKNMPYLEHLAEDLRNISTSLGHARKSWTQQQKDEILDWYLILNSWIATLLTFHFPGATVRKFHIHLEVVLRDVLYKRFSSKFSKIHRKMLLCTQVFFCEFCKISKNTYFYRTPPVAASPHFLK